MYVDLSLEEYLKAGMEARSRINCNQIRSLSLRIGKSLENGGKLVAFGNGGSAADAQHFVAELTGHFSVDRPPLAAVCLNTNVSGITAISNDYSYDVVFSRQVQALVDDRDLVFGISTSGNSQNVIRGIEEANRIGAYTVAMTGRSGGKLRNIARETLSADSEDVPIIQEMHIAMIHMMSLELDRYFQKKEK